MRGIKAVAQRAGVHFSTVSRVLSHPEVVAPSTRARVLAAIKALNYAPNTAAAGLRRQQSGKILVITPDLSNAIFPMVLGGIEAAAHEAGFAVLLGYTAWGERDREDRYARMMANAEADGLVFLSPEVPRAARQMVAAATRGRPARVVNVLSCEPAARIPSVSIDNERAASDAVDYLLSLGHRRIGLVTGPRGVIVDARVRGVRKRLRQAGLRGTLPWVEESLSIEGGRHGAERLLAQHRELTAIFCTKDEQAIGALQGARLRGLRVPQDLSVVGFDGVVIAQHTQPPLTTVTQPMDALGRTAVRLLIDIIGGVGIAPKVTLPHQLVVRKSTAPPRRR